MKKSIFKKVIALSIASLLSLQLFYMAFEAPIVEAITDDILVTLTVTSGITITSPADCALSPAITVSVNSAICSSTWNVKTNNATGYSLSFNAQASPSLVSGGNSFADYTTAVAETPETWDVPSGNKEFGYSAFGTDTPTGTWGTGSDCGSAGTPSATLKYRNTKVALVAISTRATTTPTTGIDTTFCGAAEQDGIYAASGSYQATVTATAVTI
ncbi:MAG: hypothetical protein AAB477_01425 [Patescibacteria group bacterium]